ncbi:MAG TPA: hypothetical protein VJK52_05550 [Candidatus Nanoarchaeia archaeon]|nr:hypothetical protein [Candidatus Nanoarchaeia archaeon]
MVRAKRSTRKGNGRRATRRTSRSRSSSALRGWNTRRSTSSRLSGFEEDEWHTDSRGHRFQGTRCPYCWDGGI